MQRRERLLALQREDETLGKRAVHFTQLRAEVERARQAKPVVGAVRTLAISEGALKRADAALRVARSRVGESLRGADLETLRGTATRSREVIGSLAAAITLETCARGAHRRGEASASRARRARAPGSPRPTSSSPSCPEPSRRSTPSSGRPGGCTRCSTVAPPRRPAPRRCSRQLLEHAALHARLPALERATADALEAVRAAELALARLRQARIDDIAGELGLVAGRGRALPRVRVAGAPRPRPTERRRRHSRAGDGRGAAGRVVAGGGLAPGRRAGCAAHRGRGPRRPRPAASHSRPLASGLRLPPRLWPSQRTAQRQVATGEARLTELTAAQGALTQRHGELETAIARLEQALADLDERIARERAEIDDGARGPRDRGRAAPGARRHARRASTS